MALSETIHSLTQLGDYIRCFESDLEDAIISANHHNKWFTVENCKRALTAIATSYLDDMALNDFVEKYPKLTSDLPIKNVGIVAAGNLPLVGFHDLLCVLLTPHTIQLKLSDKDKILFPFLIQQLQKIDSNLGKRIKIVDRLNHFDAVIATGSNNTARYFEYYFGKYPSIIRKNRNSIAILNGSETHDDLVKLGDDIFGYFGLGCRNVSKLYVPRNYDFQPLKEALMNYQFVSDHYHYRNNLDYNRTLLMMNHIPFLNIDFVNFIEDNQIASAISNVHYQYYDSLDLVMAEIEAQKEQIQCIVGKIVPIKAIPFGTAQHPSLNDYADHVDTMDFLLNLNSTF
jgi:hypothetical protein